MQNGGAEMAMASKNGGESKSKAAAKYSKHFLC